MKKLLFSCLSAIIIFTACKKESNDSNYSTWTINHKETFQTKEVTASIGCNGDNSLCAAELLANLPESAFHIAFYTDQFPQDSVIEFSSPGCFVAFYYKDAQYNHTYAKTDTLYASSINGKVRYKLPASWFICNHNPDDSILVEGIFNQP